MSIEQISCQVSFPSIRLATIVTICIYRINRVDEIQRQHELYGYF